MAQPTAVDIFYFLPLFLAAFCLAKALLELLLKDIEKRAEERTLTAGVSVSFVTSQRLRSRMPSFRSFQIHAFLTTSLRFYHRLARPVFTVWLHFDVSSVPCRLADPVRGTCPRYCVCKRQRRPSVHTEPPRRENYPLNKCINLNVT